MAWRAEPLASRLHPELRQMKKACADQTWTPQQLLNTILLRPLSEQGMPQRFRRFPRLHKERSIWIVTTSPNVSQLFRRSPEAAASWMICVTRHSNCTGLAAPLGGRTRQDGIFASPATSNSSVNRSNAADERFMRWTKGRVTRFQTNSPVSCAFRTVSFQPIEENPMIGGV